MGRSARAALFHACTNRERQKVPLIFSSLSSNGANPQGSDVNPDYFTSATFPWLDRAKTACLNGRLGRGAKAVFAANRDSWTGIRFARFGVAAAGRSSYLAAAMCVRSGKLLGWGKKRGDGDTSGFFGGIRT
jgi:hypothetical protein